MTNALTADLAALVASLPPWNYDLDDDPVWMRPVTDYGFERIPEDRSAGLLGARRVAASMNYAVTEAVEIDPTLIRYAGQPLINLWALNAYVANRATLVDPDGWFGNDHPVVTPFEDGYAVLDGTHRVAADRLAGRLTRAYVIGSA